MSYTDHTAVASFLGVTLTTAQQTEADTQAAAASAYIDQKTHRTWPGAGSVSAEQHTLLGPYLYLRHPPVTAITAVRMRWQWAGATVDTLVANADYELLDPALGIVIFRRSYDPVAGAELDIVRDDYYGRLNRIVSIDYTSTAGTPADIARAATLLVALSLYTTLTRSRQGENRIDESSLTPAFDPKLWTDEVARILAARSALVLA